MATIESIASRALRSLGHMIESSDVVAEVLVKTYFSLIKELKGKNDFERVIGVADIVINLDGAEKEDVRAAKKYKAEAYLGIALNDNNDNTNEVFAKVKELLFDYVNEYGWDDDIVQMEMMICGCTDAVLRARNAAIYLMNSENRTIRANALEYYNEFTKRQFEAIKSFVKGFPYNERKYVYIGKNIQRIGGTYQWIDDKRVIDWVFTIDQLPTDMVFPLGRPQPGLYMAHPVKTDHYYPMKGVEEALFMEKVGEFCWLVQCLGATEVSFHSNKGLSVSQGMGSTMNVNAELGVRKVSVGGGYSNNMKRDESYTSNRQVELVQHFSPKKQAYCPDDLIWLDSDPAWQRLLKQRLEGGIMEYTYKISSSETCQVSANEMEEVKANFEFIMVKANGSYNAATDNTFSRNEETEWSIYVKFAPLEELTGQNSSNTKDVLNLSDDEAEYLDMVKECLEDGEIGVRERKLLDKIRVKNGISEKRAQELEETLCAPQLTDDEKEYLEAFKDACEDGKVSDKQRRLLEKLRVMYDISEERAKQLEKYC